MSLEMTSSYVSFIRPSLLRQSLIDLLTQILVLPLSIVSPSYDQYGTWGDTVSYPVGVVPPGTGRDNIVGSMQSPPPDTLPVEEGEKPVIGSGRALSPPPGVAPWNCWATWSARARRASLLTFIPIEKKNKTN